MLPILVLRRMDAVLVPTAFTQGYGDGVDPDRLARYTRIHEAHLRLNLALQRDDSPQIADELTHRLTACRGPHRSHAQ